MNNFDSRETEEFDSSQFSNELKEYKKQVRLYKFFRGLLNVICKIFQK